VNCDRLATHGQLEVGGRQPGDDFGGTADRDIELDEAAFRALA
jgi:hypothetical protein